MVSWYPAPMSCFFTVFFAANPRRAASAPASSRASGSWVGSVWAMSAGSAAAASSAGES